MSSVYRQIREAFPSIQEADKFAIWAFGEGWEIKPVSRMDEMWNERHALDLFVKPTDSRYTTLNKMIEIYKESNK